MVSASFSWFQMVSGGFRWFQVASDGFRWFQVVPRFSKYDVKRVTDNKQFWKIVKPCLTDKTLKGERITLTENEKVVSDKRE